MKARIFGVLAAATLFVGLVTPSHAQCNPTWDLTIGRPGVGNGYAGPMTAWDDGAGERLYVGGSFTSFAGLVIRGIGRWNPATQSWGQVAGGCFSPNTNYFVAAIAPHDDGGGEDLYVGGSFATANNVAGTANFARFNGASWSSVGPALNGAVWSLASWQGSLYVGGGFTLAGATGVNGIARWDGDGWNAVGSGFGGGFAPGVFTLRAFDDGAGEKLYAGGRFSSIDIVSGMIGRWNGTSWEPVGGGVQPGGTFAGIECSAVFDADGDGPGRPALYVGGWDLSISGSPLCSVARWDGVSWAPVGQYLGGRTTALAVFDDGSGPALYAGGTAQPGINYFAKLANDQWTPAFGGVTGGAIPPGNFPSVFGLFAWNDRLVVGGNFVQIGDAASGGGAANGVAFITACPACTPDFNRDGRLNSQDFFDFVDAFFAERPGADFNGDDRINSQDFFDFLKAFFVGCN